jgi:hypothetical protein
MLGHSPASNAAVDDPAGVAEVALTSFGLKVYAIGLASEMKSRPKAAKDLGNCLL